MFRIEKTHKHLHPHHIYQLGVVLLFTSGFFLFFPYYLLMDELRVDKTEWQWYFVLPWIAFYAITSLSLRKKVSAGERVSPLYRPIVHWALLGILLLLFHTRPLNLERLYAVDLLFLVFTLFLADSYWDFTDA